MLQKAKKNFHSTYISNDSTFTTKNVKDMLLSALEELSMPSITTDFGGSDPQKSQASVAQAQETLKQAKPVQQSTTPMTMSQADFDKLPDAAPGTVVVKQGPDGKYYYYTADPTKLSYVNTVPSAGTTPPTQPQAASVAETVYDFLHSSILEDNDVIAPIEDLDNPNADSHVATVKIKIEVENKDEDEEDTEEEEKPKKKKNKEKNNDDNDDDVDEDDKDYDPLALLPPLDLSNDVQKAVSDAQQGMMPNIRVLPTDIEQIQVLRDGPIGTVKYASVPSTIKGIEEDPYGLSVVGLENDLALKMM
jgi:hypothetical protein